MTIDIFLVFLKTHVIEIVLIFLAIILNGLRQSVDQYFTIKKRHALIYEFLCKFRTFINEYKQHRFNSEIYDWLNYHAGEVQREIGDYGLPAYRPPFENYIVKNYPVIVNTLSELHKGKAHEDMILFVDDSLIRYLGDMEKGLHEIFIMTFNPFLWIRYGMQSVIVFPFNFLYWFGILDKKTVFAIKSNPIVKLTSFITAGVGFISTIMSVVVGWEQFWQALKSIFK